MGSHQQLLLLRLLKSLSAHGSWCGETHLQKCAYFLQEGLDVPLGLDFILYKHGPFSFNLRALLGEMRANLLLNVRSQKPFGPSLELSDSARTLISRSSPSSGCYSPEIEFVSTKLASKGVVELERMGTALYVLRQNSTDSADKQAERIVKLKPHISPELARKALEDVAVLLDEVQVLKVA